MHHAPPPANPADPGDLEARAEALDAADPLAPFRERFVFDDPDLVYLDGNSLGRAPAATLERLARVARDEWAGELVEAWDHWLDLPLRVGDRLADGALGAAPGSVAVTDSTTVNLYRVAGAALSDRPGRGAVIAVADDFPTDRYVVEGLAAERGLAVRWATRPSPDAPIDAAAIEPLLDDDVALVLLALVDYRSAAIADLAGIEAVARAAGAHVLWDLSHAAGAIELELARWDVGLAVGCTYKFLHGGPGAPAFLHVAPRLQGRLRPPLQGWFARRDQFAMGPGFEPRDGIAGWLTGTPPILSLAAAEEGIRVTAEAGVPAIRAKSVALGELAIDALDAWLAPRGCTLGSPREARQRGGHVAVRHADARRLVGDLARARVLVDFREPDVLRLGLSPLTTRFADVIAGVRALEALLSR